jgi:hypothetical protein
MTNQTQCPNCGSFKVRSSTAHLTKDGKEVLPWDDYPWIVAGVIVIFGSVSCCLGVGALIPLIGTNRLPISQYQLVGGMGFSIVFLGAGLILGLLAFWIVRRSAGRRFISVHRHECDLCGFHWQQVAGDPLPVVNLRPDLMAKGQQEQERRRRQMDD